MKAFLLLLTGLSIATFNAAGQGTVGFNAYPAAGLIMYSTDGVNSAPYPQAGLPQYGAAHVGFFSAPDGTILSLGANGLPDFTGWTASAEVLNIVIAGAGRAFGTVSTVGVGGANVEFEVVAWTGTATTWAHAIQNNPGLTLLGYSGQLDYITRTQLGAFGWSQPTGDPDKVFPDSPASLVTGPGGYQGIMLAVPEPSTNALAALAVIIFGVFALLQRRRRNVSILND